MIFVASYFVLTAVLVTESLVLGYVLRGTVRAALNHESRRPPRLGSVSKYPGSSAPENPSAGGLSPS